MTNDFCYFSCGFQNTDYFRIRRTMRRSSFSLEQTGVSHAQMNVFVRGKNALDYRVRRSHRSAAGRCQVLECSERATATFDLESRMLAYPDGSLSVRLCEAHCDEYAFHINTLMAVDGTDRHAQIFSRSMQFCSYVHCGDEAIDRLMSEKKV